MSEAVDQPKINDQPVLFALTLSDKGPQWYLFGCSARGILEVMGGIIEEIRRRGVLEMLAEMQAPKKTEAPLVQPVTVMPRNGGPLRVA